jgi:hypothetical protein
MWIVNGKSRHAEFVHVPSRWAVSVEVGGAAQPAR